MKDRDKTKEDLVKEIQELRKEKNEVIATHEKHLSEHKRMEEELLRSEAKYKRVSDNSPAVLYQFLMTPEGEWTFPYVSDMVESILGVPAEEIMKDSSKLLDIVHPDDQKMFQEGILKAAESLELFPLTFRFLKDREVIWVEARGMPTPLTGGGILWDGFLLDITERKQAKDRLKESEQKLRLLFNNTADLIILTDANAKPLLANPAWKAVFGSLTKYSADPFKQMHPDDIEMIAVAWQALVLGKDITLNKEYRYKASDGKYLTFETSAFPVDISGTRLYYMITHDITERKEAEIELQASEERYRTLTENIGEGIGLVNEKEIFVYANPTAEKIFGVGKRELEGLCLDKFFFGEDFNEIKKQTLKRKQGKSNVYECEIVLQDGSKKNILITATPSFVGDKFIGTFGIFRDISERKLAENEIKRKNEELQLVNAEKDKFFSIIAHDLRSPFNSFLGFTELLEKDLPTMTQDQIQKIASTMRESATNLFNLLENLLEWSRLKRGITNFSPTSFLLMPKISESISVILESATKKEIEINFDISEDLVVFADENMLKTIIRNLSSNAVKFTPKGGKVVITASSLDNNWVEISVKDTGIGMNEEIVGNLFQLNIDSSRKGTDNEPSTGLGLIICKDFIEKHGGKLWVKSKEGKGSVFYFTLPVTGQ